MCIFSRAAEVSKTNIFARSGKKGTQFLVYSMLVKAAEELAMILPIPVPKETKPDAVKFLALDKYPEFFDEMRKGWPEPVTRAAPGSLTKSEDKIKVIEVGSFIASFVPNQKDFAKLDEKFRLPEGTWEKLPQYKDYGFCVFQLKKGEKNVHPMAFEFPRADPKKLYFPTVHIHDGKVEAKGAFDHTLYAQASAGENIIEWEESPQPAEMFLKKMDETKGIVDGKDHVYRKTMKGSLKNEDVFLG